MTKDFDEAQAFNDAKRPIQGVDCEHEFVEVSFSVD